MCKKSQDCVEKSSGQHSTFCQMCYRLAKMSTITNNGQLHSIFTSAKARVLYLLIIPIHHYAYKLLYTVARHLNTNLIRTALE